MGSLRHLALLMAGLLAVSGCSRLDRLVDNQTEGVTGAASLDFNDEHLPKQIGRDRNLYLIKMSLERCTAYKRRLLYGSRVSNLTFDVLTTIFGALGTAFTPINTVHAFTAATSITSGTKTALDADVFLNATAPVMVQALDTTYDTEMDKLLVLAKSDGGGAKAVTDADIVRVHDRCSLTAAMVNLKQAEDQQKNTAANATAETASSPITDSDIQNGSTFVLPDGRIVAITSRPAKARETSLISYTVQNPSLGSAPAAKTPLALRALATALNKAKAQKPSPASPF